MNDDLMRELIRAIRDLGNGNAATEVGAMEGVGMTLKETGEEHSLAIQIAGRTIGKAIENAGDKISEAIEGAANIIAEALAANESTSC